MNPNSKKPVAKVNCLKEDMTTKSDATSPIEIGSIAVQTLSGEPVSIALAIIEVIAAELVPINIIGTIRRTTEESLGELTLSKVKSTKRLKINTMAVFLFNM